MIETLTQPAQTTENTAPQIRRKYVLTYLLSTIGPLAKESIEELSFHLYGNAAINLVRPLRETCISAGLIDNSRKYRDPFLDHVTPWYKPEEMEKVLNLEPLGPDDLPRGLIDWEAGEGTAQPLLYELYQLESLGEVRVNRDTASSPIFQVTAGGIMHCSALKVIVESFTDQPGYRKAILLAGKHNTDISIPNEN